MPVRIAVVVLFLVAGAAQAQGNVQGGALFQERARVEGEARAKKPDAAGKAQPAQPAAPGRKKVIAYRDGSDLPPCPPPTGAPLGAIDEPGAKEIIERVGCMQCHHFVQKKVGPPMKQIHDKYKGAWECVVHRLSTTKTHKEEGITADLKAYEFKVIGDYIATRNK